MPPLEAAFVIPRYSIYEADQRHGLNTDRHLSSRTIPFAFKIKHRLRLKSGSLSPAIGTDELFDLLRPKQLRGSVGCRRGFTRIYDVLVILRIA
jgi:hypothetical protein